LRMLRGVSSWKRAAGLSAVRGRVLTQAALLGRSYRHAAVGLPKQVGRTMIIKVGLFIFQSRFEFAGGESTGGRGAADGGASRCR
jgi:hypothetical protein